MITIEQFAKLEAMAKTFRGVMIDFTEYDGFRVRVNGAIGFWSGDTLEDAIEAAELED